MLRRVLLALCALALAGVQAHAQLLPGRSPGFRPGFQFIGGPVYDADFVNGLYTAGPPSVSRASPGYAADSTGTYALFGNDTLRRTNAGATVEPQDANGIRNNSGQGGVTGTPGTDPTNWLVSTPTGITKQLVSTFTESGIDFVRYRFSGTLTGSGGQINAIEFDAASQFPTNPGQQWVPSAFLRMPAGSKTGLTALTMSVNFLASDGTTSVGNVNGPDALTPLGSNIGRATGGALTAPTNSAFARPRTRIAWGASGTAVDITLDIGWPHQSQGSRLFSPLRTAGAGVTRQADVVTLPVAGVGRVVVTYDDGSTQTFSGISTGTPWTIPAANLNRSVIRRLTGYAS